MTRPLFLKASTLNQRDNFIQLNKIESSRISQGLQHPHDSLWDMSDGTRGQSRNRYTNVYPYNKSRVKLPVTSGSDYINASHIALNSNKYIACQGPLESTIHHFWAMAFHESELQGNNTIIVVMVTPLVEAGITKCSKYWPDQHKTHFELTRKIHHDNIDLPDLSVRYMAHDYVTDGDFTLSKLELKCGPITKEVFHYYYHMWADAKVPPSVRPLIHLSLNMRSVQAEHTNPPVPIVHCSAGVGRTGTFLAIDHLFHNFKNLVDDAVSDDVSSQYDPVHDPILNTVLQLRYERMMMVQTVYQYTFLYDSAKLLYKDKKGKFS